MNNASWRPLHFIASLANSIQLTVVTVDDRSLSSGAFLSLNAGPPCSSVSTAITPPCRSNRYPAGVPWAPPCLQAKMREGNALANFVGKLLAVTPPGALYVVENPDLSWLWRYRAFIRLATRPDAGLFRIDQCRFGTPWRKRTRFFTNAPSLKGHTLLCCGCPAHTLLRGRRSDGVPWTKDAEAYPHVLADVLSWAACHDLGWCAVSPLRSGSLGAAAARERVW